LRGCLGHPAAQGLWEGEMMVLLVVWEVVLCLAKAGITRFYNARIV
jgi:hypothetical protein